MIDKTGTLERWTGGKSGGGKLSERRKERKRERERAEGWKQVASRLRLVSGPFVIVNIAGGGKDYLVTDGPFAYPFDLWCTHANGSEPTRRSIDRFILPSSFSIPPRGIPLPYHGGGQPFLPPFPFTYPVHLISQPSPLPPPPPPSHQRVSYCFEIKDNEMPLERRAQSYGDCRMRGAALLFSIDTPRACVDRGQRRRRRRRVNDLRRYDRILFRIERFLIFLHYERFRCVCIYIYIYD